MRIFVVEGKSNQRFAALCSASVGGFFFVVETSFLINAFGSLTRADLISKLCSK